MNSKEVRKKIDKRMLADGMSQIIDLEKSHGSWLVDGRDSREYLDLFSMFASLSVGYSSTDAAGSANTNNLTASISQSVGTGASVFAEFVNRDGLSVAGTESSAVLLGSSFAF